MTNLCRASVIALCTGGLLTATVPALALSGGASCDDRSSFSHRPARYGIAMRRLHERPAGPALAWSPAPARSLAAPEFGRPDWAPSPPARPEWLSSPDYERPDWARTAPERPGWPSAPDYDRPAPPPTVFDRPERRYRPAPGFGYSAPETPTRPDWTLSPPARPAWLSSPDYGRPDRATRRFDTRPFAVAPPPRPEWAPPIPRADYGATGDYGAFPWGAPFGPPPPPELYGRFGGSGAPGAMTPAAEGAVNPYDAARGAAEGAEAIPGTAPAAAAPATTPVQAMAGTGADGDGDGVVNGTDLCPGTPAGTAVDALGCAADETIVLRGVNFDTDSAKLTDDSTGTLDQLAATLIANPEIEIEISGHTDGEGDAEHNFDLSTRRALMVMKYLSDKGVSGERMIARGYGAEQPVAANDTAGGKATNRRVELRRTR